jgi:Uncharacterized alpha/beta hydrolase domain (DUF2235)
VWFPGAHANVGGGLADSTLSDIALRFMVSRAEELGVLFQEAASEIRCDLKGVSPFAIPLSRSQGFVALPASGEAPFAYH